MPFTATVLTMFPEAFPGPLGVSLIGSAWSDARVLALGYAFEQATHARIDPQFLPNVGARPEFAKAYDPR